MGICEGSGGRMSDGRARDREKEFRESSNRIGTCTDPADRLKAEPFHARVHAALGAALPLDSQEDEHANLC